MGGGGGGVGGVGGVLLRLVNYAEPLQPDGPETMTNEVHIQFFWNSGDDEKCVFDHLPRIPL